jgi:hypothetical protein
MYRLGDLSSTLWHVEAKSTRNDTIRFDQKWVDKALRQAQRLERKHVAIALHFANRFGKYKGDLDVVAVFADVTIDFIRVPGLTSSTRTKGLHQSLFSMLKSGHKIPFTLPDHQLAFITLPDFNLLCSN